MRKFGLAAVLLLLTAAMAIGQQSASDQAQSAGSQAAGAASSAAGAVKSGTEKGYDATKNAVTGNSSDNSGQQQTTEQQQTTSTETTTTAHKKLPQTASPLPLLGLLGLGTFSLGAWRARLFRR